MAQGVALQSGAISKNRDSQVAYNGSRNREQTSLHTDEFHETALSIAGILHREFIDFSPKNRRYSLSRRYNMVDRLNCPGNAD